MVICCGLQNKGDYLEWAAMSLLVRRVGPCTDHSQLELTRGDTQSVRRILDRRGTNSDARSDINVEEILKQHQEKPRIQIISQVEQSECR